MGRSLFDIGVNRLSLVTVDPSATGLSSTTMAVSTPGRRSGSDLNETTMTSPSTYVIVLLRQRWTVGVEESPIGWRKAAFEGAPFEWNGFCVQLAEQVRDEDIRLVWQELQMTCPKFKCALEHHKSRRVTSLGGAGKVKQGQMVHGQSKSLRNTSRGQHTDKQFDQPGLTPCSIRRDGATTIARCRWRRRRVGGVEGPPAGVPQVSRRGGGGRRSSHARVLLPRAESVDALRTHEHGKDGIHVRDVLVREHLRDCEGERLQPRLLRPRPRGREHLVPLHQAERRVPHTSGCVVGLAPHRPDCREEIARASGAGGTGEVRRASGPRGRRGARGRGRA